MLWYLYFWSLTFLVVCSKSKISNQVELMKAISIFNFSSAFLATTPIRWFYKWKSCTIRYKPKSFSSLKQKLNSLEWLGAKWHTESSKFNTWRHRNHAYLQWHQSSFFQLSECHLVLYIPLSYSIFFIIFFTKMTKT